MRPPFPRILGVLAFVASLGGLIGALVGVTLGAILLTLLTGRPWTAGYSEGTYTWSALIGVIHGVVLGPAAAFTLLRHVPLWRAVGETALGASVGAALMIALVRAGAVTSDPARIAALLLSPAGGLVAAARLRRAVRRERRASPAAGAA